MNPLDINSLEWWLRIARSGEVRFGREDIERALGDPRTDNGYNALQLDSLSSVVAAGPASAVLNGSSPFTIDAWIRFNGLPSQGFALAQDGVFGFGSAGNTIFFQLANDMAVSDPTQGALDEDTWHHICATWDGGLLRLYIDGVFNVSQSMSPTGASNSNPVVLGAGLQGLVRSVRVFAHCFPAEDVLANMFSDAAPLIAESAAWFDFSKVPPVDIGPSALALTLRDNAAMIRVSPAMSPGSQGFARPFGDHGVNPGGAQVDPYSVQAWIYLEPGPTSKQAVFVNSDLASDTGMALYLTYDTSASGYRLVSQRGSDGDSGQMLTSTGLVPTGQWINVATTFDGQTLRLYLAGQPDSTLACHPIVLINTRSNLLIGAAIAQGYPSPTTALQGYIREVDVWSIALTALQVAQYVGQLPDPSTAGLAAAYNFTAKPGRNQVNGHPIGLAEGAVRGGQLGPASTSERTPEAETPEAEPAASPHAEFVASVRASLDLAAIGRDHAHIFAAARAADVAGFDDEASRAKVDKAWSDVSEGLAGRGPPPRFWLTQHQVGDDLLLICHRPEGSQIVFQADARTTDPCLMWKISLVFAVVMGVLDAVFAVKAVMNPSAEAYITRLLSLPALTSRFGGASAVTTVSVLGIFQQLHTLGALSPLVRLLVDLGFWALLRLLAHTLLIATGLGSAALLASLVITVANVGYLLANAPAGCAQMPTVTLNSITFNYGPGSAAIPIRQNMLHDVDVPEWTPGCIVSTDSPAAYAESGVALPQVVSIQADFTVNPNQAATISAAEGGILGAIPAFVIPGSGVRTIALPNHELTDAPVGIHDVGWTWTMQTAGAPDSTRTTRHRIYTLLGPPSAPWIVAANVQGQIPWTDVLDQACLWAVDATTAVEALTQITAQVNGSIGLTYDLAAGANHYTQSPVDQPSLFQCSLFVEFVSRQGAGNGNRVNCTDCASIVTTFANILGCDVSATHMTSPPVQPPPPVPAATFFGCNPIISIGGNAWSPPFPNLQPPQRSNGFSYHEVVVTGPALQPRIYDACLRINNTNNPWAAPPAGTVGLLPADIDFTTQAVQPNLPIATPFPDESYRERLATNNAAGIGSCVLLGPWGNTNGGRRSVI